jgi:DNA mismatch endonuclease (patch repair protein)
MTETPPASNPDVRRRMQATRRVDTRAELSLRRELHQRGLRFRKDYVVRGVSRSRLDIAFTRHKVAVFVDGCFWHSCPDHSSIPKVNTEWWTLKLETNRVRDLRHNSELESAGWTVVRVWEHEDARAVAGVLHGLLSNR